MSQAEKTWTKRYCGVSHYGGPQDRYWATVEDHGKFVMLSKWYPGCQFHPDEACFGTVDKAKAAGEKWVKQFSEFARGKQSCP